MDGTLDQIPRGDFRVKEVRIKRYVLWEWQYWVCICSWHAHKMCVRLNGLSDASDLAKMFMTLKGHFAGSSIRDPDFVADSCDGLTWRPSFLMWYALNARTSLGSRAQSRSGTQSLGTSRSMNSFGRRVVWWEGARTRNAWVSLAVAWLVLCWP